MSGDHSVALVTVDDVARAYDFGPSHPLRPERVSNTYERIAELGLSSRPNVTSVPARSASDEAILRCHGRAFVDAVKAIDAGGDPRVGASFGLGFGDNPIFEGMHRASAAVCGASLVAGEAVGRGEHLHSFNPAGGLHHARRTEASGFCIYNDPAVAIAGLLDAHPEWRVMYVDVDVHHGDGVQWIFYDDPRVLTLSLHQSGRYLYPGTGFTHETGSGDAVGTAANVPLLPGTGTEDYLWAAGEVIPRLAAAFRPDVLVTQLGGDTHHGDPLANLGLTMSAYPRLAGLLHDTAHEHAYGRWVALGGGGYQPRDVVPRIWTIHFAEMCGARDAIPAGWFEDLPEDEVSLDHGDAVRQTVAEVLDACLPRLASLAG